MRFGKMQVLTEDEVHTIHLNIMEVLGKVGIHCREKEALRVFEQGGARVDYEGERVYIPAYLAKDALQKCPDSITFYDSFGERVGEIGGEERHYGPLGYSTSYIDKNGEFREGNYAALKEEARLVDVIDEATFLEPSIQPQDMPPELQDVYMMKAVLEGTRKPTHSVANSGRAAEAIINMHAELMGGVDILRKKPRNMFNVCTFSPLTIREDACEVIRVSAKYDHPCMFSTGTMAGTTAPVTLAGSIVEALAEVIAHIVLAQLYSPGMPCAMLNASRIFDMKFAACTGATPEYYLLKTAACQMAHFYGIPAGGMALMADSNEYDVQYGWEKLASGLIARQSGMSLMWGMGMFSQLNMFGFEALAIDAEIIRVIERIARGIEVNTETLAFDVIAESAEDADFLGHEHTSEYYRDEFMMPVLSDRRTYAKYQKTEGGDMRQRAREQLESYAAQYSYKKGEENSEMFQKIIDDMCR